jgi:hypothetical protein
MHAVGVVSLLCAATVLALVGISLPPALLVLEKLQAVQTALAALQAQQATVGAAVVSVNDTVNALPAPPAGDTYTLDVACNDNNTCTADYLVTPRGTCVNAPLPTTTVCLNPACHRASKGTYCDLDKGTCETRILSDCIGNRASASDPVVDDLEFNYVLYTVADPYSGQLTVFRTWSVVSYWGLAELWVAMVDVKPNNWPTASGDSIQDPIPLAAILQDCRDVVRPDIYQRSYDCLVAERLVVGTNVTRQSYIDVLPAAARNISFQYGFCLVKYACSRLNTTQVVTVPGIVPASAEALPGVEVREIHTNPLPLYVGDMSQADRAAILAAHIGDEEQPPPTKKRATAAAMEAMTQVVRHELAHQPANHVPLQRWLADVPTDMRDAYMQHMTQHMARSILTSDV